MTSFLFIWRGYDRRGRQRSGRAWAQSRAVLQQRLSSFLVGISVQYSWYMLLHRARWREWWRRVRARTMLSGVQAGQVCATLATLLTARVPLAIAFELVAKGAVAPEVARVAMHMAYLVREGQSSAACFKRTAAWWPAVVPVAVAAGMQRGELVHVLTDLGNSLAMHERYRQRLWRALAVPLLTLGVASVVGIGVGGMLIPLVAEVGGNEGLRDAQVIMQWVQRYGVVVLWAAVASSVVVWRLLATRSALHCWRDRQLYRLPVIGQLLRAIHTVMTIRLWEVLLCAEVPLCEVMRASADLTRNEWWRQRMLHVAERLEAGDSFVAVLTYGPFPRAVNALLCLAASQEQLGGMCHYARTLLRQQVEHVLEIRLALLQPVLLVLIGGGVLWGVSRALVPLLSFTG